jgi:ABC-2 type transport system permease protein
LLSLFSGVFNVVIQCFLWTALYRAGVNDLYGYTYAEIMAYSIISGVVAKLVGSGFEWEIMDDVKSGGLDKFIVKPIGYAGFRFSNFMGRKAAQCVMVSVIMVAVLFGLHAATGISFTLPRILFFLAYAALAICLNFFIYYCLSALAFVLTECWGVFIGGGLIISILSGALFPLDIFGPIVTRVFDFLPFKYVVYMPINVLTGRAPDSVLLPGLGLQLLWIVALFFLSKAIWARSTKKYIAVGG